MNEMPDRVQLHTDVYKIYLCEEMAIWTENQRKIKYKWFLWFCFLFCAFIHYGYGCDY